MKVSILIVTYQSEDEILNCIKSIYQNVNKIVFEIIIIDNASTDKTIKIIKDNFPEITIIENEQNKGFSFANNLGAKSAKGEFLFFLNPDSLIVENTIEKLVSIYNMDEKIGIIGPEIKNINGSIQPPALKIPSILTTLFEAFGLYLFIPNTILGFPYVQATDMPDVGAGAFPVLFGDFSRAYMIVDRVALAVQRDPFTQATSGNVRYVARRRVGGQVVQAEAIVKQKVSA